jgi:putative ABC transport system ATP-binding protein
LLADEPTGNLDSKNGEAVIVLLTNFHQKGATFYMVRHNPEFFKFAQHTLHIFGGRIVDKQWH